MSSGYPPPPSYSAPPPPPPDGRNAWQKLKTWQKVVIPIAAAFTFFAIIGAIFGESPDDTDKASDKTPTTSTSSTSAPTTPSPKPSEVATTKTAKPSPTPTPTPTPKPSKSAAPKPDSKAEMEDAVKDAKVDGAKIKQDGNGVWHVTFNVSDNLSNKYIRLGIAQDVFALSKQIEQEIGDKTAYVREVQFEGMFPLVDTYGNEKPGRVFYGTLSGDTISKINYDNLMTLDFDSLEALAAAPVFLFPDLRE